MSTNAQISPNDDSVDAISDDEFRSSLHDVLAVECESRKRRALIDGDAASRRALWKMFAELGWFGVAITEPFGGLGQSETLAFSVIEEFGASLVPLPALPTLATACLIERCGTREQKAAWLPQIANGYVIFALSTGLFDFKGKEIDRLPDQLVDGADIATHLIFPAPGPDQGLQLIAADSAALSLKPAELVDETRKGFMASVDSTAVSDEELIPVSGGDLEWMEAWYSLAIGCDAIGGAAAILDETVEYLKVREQFGRPIGSFQALKHRIATWKIRLESARALVNMAVGKFAAADDAPLWASRAKYFAADAYAAISADAIQLHGGIGFTWEHDCHLYFKRAKFNQAVFGNTRTHLDRISFLTLPADGPAPQDEGGNWT